MSFFDALILDTILILFPMICILIIKASVQNNCRATEKGILIDIANLSSLFLLIKYCDINSNYMILLINMPFVISMINNRKYASLTLGVFLIIFNIIVGINYIFVIGEYLIYMIVFVLLYKKGFTYSTIISSFVFIKGIFLTINEYYVLNNDSLLTILEIFICLVSFYLIGILVISINNMIDKTVTINQTLKELEREKNLKNSLFKITHEIKNPIAVCKGYLQMMDYDDIDKVKKYNKTIEGELNRTLDIMDNFSAYTKIKINLDIMDLDFLITETINDMSSMFRNKKIEVNYNSTGEVFINGDYARLKQVFVNILKNSVEAIEDDGVIGVNIKKTKKYVIISIRDNGIGMSDEEISKISELFYSSKEKGCGIGVSLSKEIIGLHKGSLKYNSVPGEYTEAIIRIPVYTQCVNKW